MSTLSPELYGESNPSLNKHLFCDIKIVYDFTPYEQNLRWFKLSHLETSMAVSNVLQRFLALSQII